MDREQFESKSQGQAPWDIVGPQPAIVWREEAGAIRGSVLDAGCGTGENARYLASRGHEVWGIDEWHSVKRNPKITKGLRLESPNVFGDRFYIKNR